MNEYTTEERIYKLHVFKFRAKNVERMYILFILSGWSYGSMDQIGKQILYYLTLGGLGIWAIYRLFTLNRVVKEYNREIANDLGFSEKDKLLIGVY